MTTACVAEGELKAPADFELISLSGLYSFFHHQILTGKLGKKALISKLRQWSSLE